MSSKLLTLPTRQNAPQTRKYYIASEVRKIDLPDVDEQELPHSVRLMLRGGGMLQCACQNNAEQKQLFSGGHPFGPRYPFCSRLIIS